MEAWIREHFVQIVGGVVGLLVLSWLYHHAGRLFADGKPKGRYFCRHCNWEGNANPRSRRCRRCGSVDLVAVTH